jgi:glutamate synthase domain-containing protein 2
MDGQDYLKAEDSDENAKLCFCPNCPSYPQGCRGEELYCARGVSHCDIHAAGCDCPQCPVYRKYKQKGLYFCDQRPLGLGQVVQRKGGADEPAGFRAMVTDIKEMAKLGKSVPCAMGSLRALPFTLDDLFFLPAQVSRFPRNADEPVDTAVTVGPRAEKPLVLPTPLLVAAMSYGAVSRNVRLSIARGAKAQGFGFNSGEGGILPEELDLAGERMIAQCSTGRFGTTADLLKRAAAVELRFGQGAYPGKGSVLPGSKVTKEVAMVRGVKEGADALSPARHPDVSSPEQVKDKVGRLRRLMGGRPVGAKIGCGHVEDDVDALIDAGVDFVALDGFGGGTGATDLFVRENCGLPIVAALPRAVHRLEERGARDRITVIASGGLRNSGQIAKCLALGADAVYLGTAALIAINCQQYRVCYSDECPTGVTTQLPERAGMVDPEEGARKLAAFIRVSTDEVAELTRVVGKNRVKDLDKSDLASVDRDLAALTGTNWLDGRPAR